MSGKAIGIQGIGQIHAKQIRGAPDYPVQNLYACNVGPQPYVFWLLNNLCLTEGVLFRSDGHVSFAPAMVARMRIKRFAVWAYIDGFDPGATYAIRLVYSTKDGEFYEQLVERVDCAEKDFCSFEIPLDHVDTRGWFTCACHITLLTPIPPGDERTAAREEGIEEPHMPVILRGAYLEIKG